MAPDGLSKLTVKKLKALARERGLSGYSSLRKAELVALIADNDVGAAEVPKHAQTPSVSSGGGSSTLTGGPASPAPAATPSLPDDYGQDRLQLMVQDPSHVFAYWELTPSTLARKRDEIGEDGVPVLLIHSRYGQEQRVVDLSGGNYYLCVSSDTTYRSDIGLRDRQGRIHILASSVAVHTPSDRVSDRTDESWLDAENSFHALLERAGLMTGIGSSAALAGERRLWSETGVESISSLGLSSREAARPGPRPLRDD